ncbi:MAG: S8 family serine peptidase [Oligoflexia bacterium]|nr:S8 family serine peptidase [Oligoflexia bacterium]
MLRIQVRLLCTISSLFILSIVPALADEHCVPGEIIPGEFLVKADPGHSLLQAQALAQASGFERHSLGSTSSGATWEHWVQKQSSKLALNVQALTSSGLIVEPNRKVCAFQAVPPTFKFKGFVRPRGASMPRFPKAIAYNKSNSLHLYNSFGLGTVLNWDLPFNIDYGYHVQLLDLQGAGFPELGVGTYSYSNNFIPGVGGFTTDGYYIKGVKLATTGVLKSVVSDPLGASRDLFNEPNFTDFNADGVPDYIAVFHNKNANDWEIIKLGPNVPSVVAAFQNYPRLGDLNGDGLLDVVTTVRSETVVNYQHFGYTTYDVYYNSNGSFPLLPNYSFTAQEGEYDFESVKLYFTDFNADGKLDILTVLDQALHPGKIVVHQNNTSGFGSAYYTFNSGNAKIDLTNTDQDFNGDGIKDLLFAHHGVNSDSSTIYIGITAPSGSGAIYPTSNSFFASGKPLRGLSFEDYDGDGVPDILASSETEMLLFDRNTGATLPSFDRIVLDQQLNGDELVGHGFHGAPRAFDPLAVNFVHITLTSFAGSTYSTYSDMQGQFSFSELPGGNYVLTAERAGFEFAPQVVNINQDLEGATLRMFVLPPPAPQPVSLPSEAPNDPGFARLWGLYNAGQEQGIPGVDIKALQAWGISQGDPNLVVAEIDEGIDYNHPDLKPNILLNNGEIPGNGIDDDGNTYVDDYYGYNSVDANGEPLDVGGHGTHVAGTIGALGNNSLGVVGVAPKVKLLPVKVLGVNGGSVVQVIQGLYYIKNRKLHGDNIRVINASLGGGGTCIQAYLDILNDLNALGIVFVAAAGNDGSDNDQNSVVPANCDAPNVITVANLTRTGVLAQSSNFGHTTVDLGAPGSSILSTYPNGTYQILNGTSMASPHVAGAAALLLSSEPGLTPAQVRSRLLSTVTPLAQLNGKLVAAGMLDIYAALQAVPALTPTPGAGGSENPSATPTPSSDSSEVVQFKEDVGRVLSALSSETRKILRTGMISPKSRSKITRYIAKLNRFASSAAASSATPELTTRRVRSLKSSYERALLSRGASNIRSNFRKSANRLAKLRINVGL